MKSTTFGAICVSGGIQTGPFGSQLHAHEYTPQGVPVVMPQDIGDNILSDESIARVPEAVASRVERHRLENGDIVYSRRGDVERRALVRPREAGWLCGTGCLRARVDREKADPGWVSYYLGSEHSRTWIKSHAVGATMPNLNTAILSALPIDMPPLPTQRAIAEALGALDDKIAANQRVALAADDLAMAEFQRLVAGVAPELPLSELVSTQYGITTSPVLGGSHRLARVTDINKRPWIEWDGAPVCDLTQEEIAKYCLSAGDIVVARMADPGKVGIVDEGAPESVFASYLVRVRPLVGLDPLFLYYFLRSPAYVDYSLSSMQGSVQSNMNARVIVGASIPEVSLAAQASFGRLARGLRVRMAAAIAESRRLATLRDTLLPHLMSGRITVRGAEERLEADHDAR